MLFAAVLFPTRQLAQSCCLAAVLLFPTRQLAQLRCFAAVLPPLCDNLGTCLRLATVTMPRGRSRGGPGGRGASRRGVTGGRGRRTQAAPYSVPVRRSRRTQHPPPPPTDNQVVTSPPAETVKAASPPLPDAANSAAERQVSDLSMADFLQTIRDIVREERAATSSTTQGNTRVLATSTALDVPARSLPVFSSSSLPPVPVSATLPPASTPVSTAPSPVVLPPTSLSGMLTCLPVALGSCIYIYLHVCWEVWYSSAYAYCTLGAGSFSPVRYMSLPLEACGFVLVCVYVPVCL